MSNPLLHAEHLFRSYQSPRRRFFQPKDSVVAVNDVSLTLESGSSTAIVGESGSGKSTLLRLLLGLERPDRGSVQFDGKLVDSHPRNRMLWMRSQTGLVLQDPFSSLDPRMRIRQIVAEPLTALSVQGDHDQLVEQMLDRVELGTIDPDCYPHELSGGQRQRVAIARALVHSPRLLVGDEPVSALDIRIRQRIVELISQLKAELNLSFLTVTHDISIAVQLTDQIIVMKNGEIVESGDTLQVLTSPKHEYTKKLVDAVPTIKWHN